MLPGTEVEGGGAFLKEKKGCNGGKSAHKGKKGRGTRVGGGPGRGEDRGVRGQNLYSLRGEVHFHAHATILGGSLLSG